MLTLDQRFDRGSLCALRAAVAAHAVSLGAHPDQVGHLVIIANELAANAVQHGGGWGRLRLRRTDATIRCEVSDCGPGIRDPRGAGTVAPGVLSASGRGLWIVRCLTAGLRIDSSRRGTTITAIVLLAPR